MSTLGFGNHSVVSFSVHFLKLNKCVDLLKQRLGRNMKPGAIGRDRPFLLPFTFSVTLNLPTSSLWFENTCIKRNTF